MSSLQQNGFTSLDREQKFGDPRKHLQPRKIPATRYCQKFLENVFDNSY